MPAITIENLSFAYPGAAESVFENLSLRLDTGWKLGLVGRNGRGKTTLLRLLAGEYEYSGRISAPVGFSRFPAISITRMRGRSIRSASTTTTNATGSLSAADLTALSNGTRDGGF